MGDDAAGSVGDDARGIGGRSRRRGQARRGVLVEVFYSYAHEDEALRDDLNKHLVMLKRQGIIRPWYDRKIPAGTGWRGTIDEHLELADVVLLLVSPDFLNSDYCYDVEMGRAMERHRAGETRVIPIIMRPCDWRHPPLGELQALPTDGRPVTLWADRDDAFFGITQGIRIAVEEIQSRESRPIPDTPATCVTNVEAPSFPLVGREALLQTLRTTFLSGQHRIQVLYGLGGMGKSRLAIEYAIRYMDEYDLVWLLQAAEPARLADDYAIIADALKLHIPNLTDPAAVVAGVRGWLAENQRWLLIFDDAVEPETLSEYVSGTPRGHVLVTSRNPNWRGFGVPLSIPPLTRDDAIQLLVQRSGQMDVAGAHQVAEQLGNLPLALQQAGSYVEATGASFESYAQLFELQRSALWSAQRSPTDHDTIATTLRLALSKVATANLAAIDLLRLCAHFAPGQPIPISLLHADTLLLPTSLAEIIRDEGAWNEAIEALLRYSLVERSSDTLSVHQLVQGVIRDSLTSAERRQWAGVAIRLIEATYPANASDVRAWQNCASLLPHALIAADYAEAEGTSLAEVSEVLDRCGGYMASHAQFDDARLLRERALRIAEQIHGSDHRAVATRASNLGRVFRAMGHLNEARALFERSLRIDEATLGPDHTDVATVLSNLGDLLREIGELEEGRICHERALRIDEANFGQNHPTVARDVTNLGGILLAQGNLEDAHRLFERALRIDEATYGLNHPEVAADFNNLGSVLHDLGDLHAAKAFLEQALKIDETVYGPDHPIVARDINNLGYVLQELGDLHGARANYERAIRVGEATYGPVHPDVATWVYNLGRLLHDLGDQDAARSCIERALRIAESVYGPNHPTTELYRANLEALGPA